MEVTIRDISALTSIVLAVGLGFVPFFVAKAKGATRFAVSALVLCIVAGLLTGFLGSAPVALAFSLIALLCSPERLQNIGEKEPDGYKDIAIFFVFFFMLVGILVILAFRFEVIG